VADLRTARERVEDVHRLLARHREHEAAALCLEAVDQQVGGGRWAARLLAPRPVRELAAATGEVVNRAGYASPVRSPRGRDIMAACGQLKSASVKQRASARQPTSA